MKRIINHKRIDLTDDEWNLYQEICRSYDRPNFKGESLFVDLFEADEDGIIQFLRPPSKNFTSMEVFLFMMSIFCHQHLRVVYVKADEALKDVDETLVRTKSELEAALKEVDETLTKAKKELEALHKMTDELRVQIEAKKPVE